MVGTGAIGVIFLASGIEGYLVCVGRLGPVARIFSIGGGFLLFMPGWPTNITGALLAAIVVLAKFLRSKFS